MGGACCRGKWDPGLGEGGTSPQAMPPPPPHLWSHSPWPRLLTEASISYTVLLSWVWIALPMFMPTPAEHSMVCRAGP